MVLQRGGAGTREWSSALRLPCERELRAGVGESLASGELWSLWSQGQNAGYTGHSELQRSLPVKYLPRQCQGAWSRSVGLSESIYPEQPWL